MPVEVLPSAPVLCWMVPPLPGVPVPVTRRPPLDPVWSRMMPVAVLLAAVPDVMRWNVTWLAPMVVLAMLSAVPLLESIVLFEPVTVTVPSPVALKPAPDVVAMSSPPFVKSIVVPRLSLSETAGLVPVVRVLAGPVRATVPPVLFATLMPEPLLVMVPA